MSLGSFLSKIWDHIKTIFGALPKELKEATHIGVVVTENIKNFVDSPVADVLTAIIPTEIDDNIKALLRAKLPVILSELKLADSCTGLTDPNEITACAIKVLQGIDGNVNSAFLHNISVLVAQVAADGKLTWADGVYLLQWYYEHKDNADVAIQIGA